MWMNQQYSPLAVMQGLSNPLKRESRNWTKAQFRNSPLSSVRRILLRAVPSLHLHSYLSGRKGPDIGKFGNPLVGGPVCMRAPDFNADENRAATALSSLHCCGELKGVAWNHAVVVIRRGHKSSRITDSRFSVVHGRVFNEIGELV